MTAHTLNKKLMRDAKSMRETIYNMDFRGIQFIDIGKREYKKRPYNKTIN